MLRRGQQRTCDGNVRDWDKLKLGRKIDAAYAPFGHIGAAYSSFSIQFPHTRAQIGAVGAKKIWRTLGVDNTFFGSPLNGGGG